MDRRPVSKSGRRAAAVMFVAALTVAITSAEQGPRGVDPSEPNGRSPYAIGLWGDLPYSPAQEQIGVPNLIADMNAQRLAFSVHDGDLKQGANSPCDAVLYQRSLDYFNALEAPAMFTPGDNDWTDCDRPSNGGYSSLDRLDYERFIFFSTPYSHGPCGRCRRTCRRPRCVSVSAAPSCHAWKTGAGRCAV